MQKQKGMVKPIKNKKQYTSYHQRAYALMQADLRPNTPEADEFELLTIVVEAYENQHYPIRLHTLLMPSFSGLISWV